MVHPAYRGGIGILTKLAALLETRRAGNFGVEGIHGEPVLNHACSQKMCGSLKWTIHALEADLMPDSAYEKENCPGARVSAPLDFKTLTPKPHVVHLPYDYEEQLRFFTPGWMMPGRSSCRTWAVNPGPGQR